MTALIPLLEWRPGRGRLLLPAAVHAIAAYAAIDLALQWQWAWLFVAVVLLSAGDELRRWRRACRRSYVLGLCSGGIVIDETRYRARRGWLGPLGTAVWLTDPGGRRRLLSIWRGELTGADYAALRRHVKALDFSAR